MVAVFGWSKTSAVTVAVAADDPDRRQVAAVRAPIAAAPGNCRIVQMSVIGIECIISDHVHVVRLIAVQNRAEAAPSRQLRRSHGHVHDTRRSRDLAAATRIAAAAKDRTETEIEAPAPPRTSQRESRDHGELSKPAAGSFSCQLCNSRLQRSLPVRR